MPDKIQQRAIYTAVAARGYREGWTKEQFITRQVCKLIEEVAELALTVTLPGRLGLVVQVAGKAAREAFDTGTFDNAGVMFETLTVDEAADCFVVLSCIGEELGVDLAQLALDKARADTERGVR